MQEDGEDVSTTQQMVVEGKMVSLNKETNRGTFKTTTGKSLPYRLAMEKPEEEYSLFAYKGYVRIECVGHINKDLDITRIDITKIEKLQTSLFNE